MGDPGYRCRGSAGRGWRGGQNAGIAAGVFIEGVAVGRWFFVVGQRESGIMVVTPEVGPVGLLCVYAANCSMDTAWLLEDMLAFDS